MGSSAHAAAAEEEEAGKRELHRQLLKLSSLFRSTKAASEAQLARRTKQTPVPNYGCIRKSKTAIAAIAETVRR